MVELNRQDIHDLALGASLLGSGGGGSPYLGSLTAEEVFNQGHTFQLISIDELPANALIAGVAEAGSSAVCMEKIQNPSTGLAAIRAMEAYLGRKIDALIPLEIGGQNAMSPFYLAGLMGIPTVDADGMGRAFPEIQMLTFDIYGDFEKVLTIANDYGDVELIHGETQAELEQVARELIIAWGGTAFICEFVMSKAEAKRVSIPGTLTAALQFGRDIREARENNQDIVAAISAHCTKSLYRQAKQLFRGKIADVTHENDGGFTRGECLLENEDGHMILTFQNENLLAMQNAELKAIVPDLICVLDDETGEPLSTSDYRYGQRVIVLAIQAPSQLTTPEALETLGPKCFNLEAEYAPL